MLGEVPAGARVVALGRTVKTAAPALAAYLRRERPAALYAHMFPLTWMAVVARMLPGTRVPLVLVEHIDFDAGFRAHPRSRALMRRLGRWIYPRADRRVCVSAGAADSLAALARIDRQSIDVVYNPVSLPAAPNAPTASNLADWWASAPVRLLAVGRLIAQKDYDTMLAAVAALPETMGAKLLILGDGPDRARLEGAIAAMGLGDRVRLGGFQPDREAYYARASVYVMSSRWEGLPTVLIEALIAGLPVVSTDCPSGPSEILDGGRVGTLVPMGDSKALAKAIVAAAAAEPDREMLRARGRDFDPPAAAKRYLALIGMGSDER
ncbi:glycosyltransferase [Sphingomonas rosea]|uniref:Glycosyltransferase n=1 Tax=Sphingomonas rosea TaxID=335605 RepID=A0ABP7UAN4_9SPHN